MVRRGKTCTGRQVPTTICLQSAVDSRALRVGEEERVSSYNEQVGKRLRSIRKQRGLSLQDVQRLSEQEFKAAVLGAYERGERSLSLPRLRRLADFYGVPVGQLLPQEAGAEAPSSPASSGGLTLDLNRIENLSGQDAVVVERFLRGIQMLRQDFNGRVLTVRNDDLRTLAMLLDVSENDFNERLIQLGVTAEGS
jgi:transcriptional regulator with XRE-family HTH domain